VEVREGREGRKGGRKGCRKENGAEAFIECIYRNRR